MIFAQGFVLGLSIGFFIGLIMAFAYAKLESKR